MKETQYISSDFLTPRDAWDKLSIEEQAAMMKAAISEGILNLGTIRQKYNEFAEGGNTDDDLVDWIIREEGFIANPRDIGDGKMTLGSGLTAQKWHDLYKRNGNKWTSGDNRRAVREEVANRRRWAERNIPNWDSLPASSQKALLSYKYNYDFNQANSPKLFKALADSNLQEAARQMDATSSNPAFKKGLQDRRQREQEWFLRDVASSQPTDIAYQPAVSTQVYNPYVQQVEVTRMLPINEPDPNSYIRTREVSPQEQRRRKFQENVEAYQRFNALMNLIDLRNNPAPSYVPSHPLFELVNGFAEGGDASNKFPIGGPISIGTAARGAVKAAKQRLYENLSPIGYDDLSRVPKAIFLNEPDRYHDTMKDMPVLDEIYAQYLGIPEEDRHFNKRLEKSAYKPTMGGEDVVYYKLPQTKVNGRTILGDNNRYNGFSNTSVDTMVSDATYMDPNTNKQQLNTELGYYTVGRGRDESGDYVSYYDEWDINPFKGGLSNKSALPKNVKHTLSNISMDFGTPVHIYDRIYFDDYYGIKGDDRGGHYLPEIIVTGKKHSVGGPLVEAAINEFKEGGGIHIKPENRGKFTRLKERTGHSATWFKEHGTPAQKKMATFALNARKWKHGEGGNLYPGGGFMGLLPAIPGMALIPSSNTLNIAKAAVKGTVKGISSFITGEGEPLREAGTTFIQNLNAKNKADALDAAMHSTQGGEVMSTNDLLNVGIPNYFRKLTGQPMDINYTGSYLADGITPNTKRDLINLYLKGDTTGFEDVTDNTYYNNGPDYVKYFRENYPNIKPRTYKMSSDGVPLELSEEEYEAATKNLNKNLRMKEDSRSNADNVANFNRWYKMIDGKLYAIDSDVWDFNPKDWAWEKGDEEMANSNGTPFILKAIRPVIKKKTIKRKSLGGNLFSGEEELI